jgi:hypothetical protein
MSLRFHGRTGITTNAIHKSNTSRIIQTSQNKLKADRLPQDSMAFTMCYFPECVAVPHGFLVFDV